jgi:hypothetical protein
MSVPASTLQCCGEDLLATPSFIIQAPTPAALFGGSLLGNIGEEQLRSTANFTLSITLSGDEWSAAMDTVRARVRVRVGFGVTNLKPPP